MAAGCIAGFLKTLTGLLNLRVLETLAAALRGLAFSFKAFFFEASALKQPSASFWTPPFS